MKPARIFVLLLAVAAAPLLAAGPELSGTYTVADAKTSGDAVSMTFSFRLRAAQPTDLVIQEVKLGNPAASDQAYGTFPGGTIHPGGELTGSAPVTVPKRIYKKWQKGQPAALFVKTTGDSGGPLWTRVDASAAGPVN